MNPGINIEQVGWIARSERDDLFLFLTSPKRISITSEGEIPNTWGPILQRYQIPSNLFPEIEWESEPMKIKLTIETLEEPMKELTIRYGNLTLTVYVGETNTQIKDSYQVKKRSDMEIILNLIRFQCDKEEDKSLAINKLSLKTMIQEWRAHNLIYSLRLWKSHTRDVDLNTDKKLWEKILYPIVSLMYWK